MMVTSAKFLMAFILVFLALHALVGVGAAIGLLIFFIGEHFGGWGVYLLTISLISAIVVVVIAAEGENA